MHVRNDFYFNNILKIIESLIYEKKYKYYILNTSLIKFLIFCFFNVKTKYVVKKASNMKNKRL